MIDIIITISHQFIKPQKNFLVVLKIRSAIYFRQSRNTYKVSDSIQLNNTARFGCGLLTYDVKHLPNIFLQREKKGLTKINKKTNNIKQLGMA